MKNFFDIIENSPLFFGISPVDLETLLGCLGAREVAYEKNAIILPAGHSITDIGLVLAGRAMIIDGDIFGNRTIIGQVLPGELFAEAFCCAGIAQLPVSVEAAEDCTILFFNYRRVITSCPTTCGFHGRLIENMLGILARRNVMLTGNIRHISRRSTREKLLSFLLAEAKKAGNPVFSIPFDRQELADHLCVERSAMSAELGRMRNEGLLRFDKNRFELLKRS